MLNTTDVNPIIEHIIEILNTITLYQNLCSVFIKSIAGHIRQIIEEQNPPKKLKMNKMFGKKIPAKAINVRIRIPRTI